MQTTIETKPHYEVLDGLRGVAAAMVVAFHLFETYSGGDHTRQIINHGYLAVDFFFVLSGFVIGYAYDDRWGKGMSERLIGAERRRQRVGLSRCRRRRVRRAEALRPPGAQVAGWQKVTEGHLRHDQ